MSLDFAQGTYTGDGGTQSITGLGFQPKVVVVKGDTATKGFAGIRTATMSGGQQCTNTGAILITSLDADGFTVGFTSAATADANANGVTYYWYAFGGSSCVSSSYVGNGSNGHAITGVGFAPVFVLIVSSATSFTHWKAASTNCADFGTGNDGATTITSLDGDGFTVDSGSHCNNNGSTFHYVAIGSASNFSSGSYAGNSTDNRNLPSTPLAFNPTVVCIKARAGQFCDWKVNSLAGDATLIYGNAASAANKIQSLSPAAGQFQVGTDAEVNNSILTYDWFAATISPAVEYTYVGSGGITFAGAAPLEKDKVYQPTGGIVFGGAASLIIKVKGYVPNPGFIPTGGLVFGGGAVTSFESARAITEPPLVGDKPGHRATITDAADVTVTKIL